MANYIKSLQEQNAALQAKVDALETASAAEPAVLVDPYSQLAPEEDGRGRSVTIVYGPNAQNLREETLPLQAAFDRLVAFYGSRAKPTDRNIPREYTDQLGAVKICNQTACYVKKTFQDLRSGQKVENLRKEVPLWLAVDDRVQKEQQVELISIKEFEDFYNQQVKQELRQSRAYLEQKRQLELEHLIQEEL